MQSNIFRIDIIWNWMVVVFVIGMHSYLAHGSWMLPLAIDYIMKPKLIEFALIKFNLIFNGDKLYRLSLQHIQLLL